MNTNNLKSQLEYIINNEPYSMRAFVAAEALESDNIEIFFSDLQQHGCISGMIVSLIYYSDTHKFFDKYYDEIEELRRETEDNLGEAVKIENDLKNTLAWFGFEETAYKIYIELEI